MTSYLIVMNLVQWVIIMTLILYLAIPELYDLVKTKFILFESESIIEPFLRFTYIENSGLAFGLPVGNFDWLLFLITLIISFYISYYIISYNKIIRYEALSLSLILGGAIGNLIDRGFKLFGMFEIEPKPPILSTYLFLFLFLDEILDIKLTKLSAAAILTPLFSYVYLCFFIIIKHVLYK